MNNGKIKLFAASVILAGNIVLLPGCHYETMEKDDNSVSVCYALNQLNDLNGIVSNYKRQKRIENIYSRINEESVKVTDVLAQTNKNSYTFYGTGRDLMVIIEGDENVVWFSSNITPSDAYSGVSSYNSIKDLENLENVGYLNPSSVRYMIGNTNGDININYSEGGKLQIDIKEQIKTIVVCEVTDSKVKNFNSYQTEKYVLNQPFSYNIPDYALRTLRNFETIPLLYMKDEDTLGVTYDGNYFETYIGFAEEDFDSIPFFRFQFNDLNKQEKILHKT